MYPTIDALDVRFDLTPTIDISVKSLVVIAGALLTLGVLHLVVNRTKIGMAIRAVAEDQAAASLMDINVNPMGNLRPLDPQGAQMREQLFDCVAQVMVRALCMSRLCRLI